ncbi:hypothetical protein GH714_034947 [Hevea brasiliensis]|uniref:DUF4219 domain-containing protein n=1 Tax=Hevea brasiliensis TaxID=3981 RepID=A0A6A6LQG5_HEVBR|nr:hypothetical protein GH714_034947 [Hevea brasiliensis]
MKTYLKAFDLWNVVETGEDPPPLRANPTLAQIKNHNEESMKKFKALTCIQTVVSDSIFTRIMACETAKEAWDKLKEEFQGSERTIQMRVLNLRREFENLKMKDSDTIQEFTDRLLKVVNQIRMLGAGAFLEAEEPSLGHNDDETSLELELELSLGHVGDCENNYFFLQKMVPWMGQNNGLGELCLGEGLEPSLEEIVPSTEQSNRLGKLCPGEELEHSLEVGEPSLRHDDDETSLVLELSLGHDDDESSLVLELSFGHDGVDVVYVLNIPKPAENENETVQETRNRQKWDNDDEICRGHILNGMSDALFDVYQNETTAKALWEKLEAKYMQEDATNIKRALKHKKEDMSIKELAKHLHVEEEYRLQDENKEQNAQVQKVHVMEGQ